MSHKRFIGIAVTAVIVIGFLLIGSSIIRQSAWKEGYVIGRLSAEDGAAIPYAPYRYAEWHPRAGFSGFFCTAGLFVLLLVAAGSFFRFWAWQKVGEGNGGRWTKRWHHHWKHAPPWCWEHSETSSTKAEESESKAETSDSQEA